MMTPIPMPNFACFFTRQLLFLPYDNQFFDSITASSIASWLKDSP
jgi:hypothetical protein